MLKLNRQQRHARWVERLERFLAAHVTVTEFCRQEAVSVASFYAWRKRLAPARGPKTHPVKNRAGGVKFLPLVVSAATTPLLLRLPGSAAIELPSQLGRRQLTDLIAAVVEATDSSRSIAEDA